MRCSPSLWRSCVPLILWPTTAHSPLTLPPLCRRGFGSASSNRSSRSSLEICFTVLGVKSGATMEDIQEAFHALAKQYHPDRGGSTQSGVEKMKRITAAYNELVTSYLENGHQPHPTDSNGASFTNTSSSDSTAEFSSAKNQGFSRSYYKDTERGYTDEAYRRTCEFYAQRQAARARAAQANSQHSSDSFASSSGPSSRASDGSSTSSSSSSSSSSNGSRNGQAGGSPTTKAWWWLNKFGQSNFALEDFFAWVEPDPEFQSWKARAFRGNQEEVQSVFQGVYSQYFATSNSSDHGSDWGLEYVQRTFRTNKQICERGMIQYYSYLQDAEILSRVNHPTATSTTTASASASATATATNATVKATS